MSPPWRSRLTHAIVLGLVASCGGQSLSGPGIEVDAGRDGGGGLDAPAGGGVDAAVLDAPLALDAATPDGPLVPDARVVDAPPALDAALSDGSSSGADARPADARPTDARPADARPADARPADARPPDARPPDAGGDCDPLETLLDDETPYLVHEDGASTSVTSIVSGTGPFTCSLYTGGGRGTRPGDVVLSACALEGGADLDDKPGQYGFIVRVRDACGATVDVPVAYRHADCDADVSFTPAPWPPRVPDAPLTGYVWNLEVDFDLVDTGNNCTACYGFSLGTLPPAQISGGLDCPNPGSICSDCDACIGGIDCDQPTVTMSREVTVKPHNALRTDGGPAWLTLEVNLIYSGSTLPPMCGPNAFACHVEALER